MIYIKCDLLYL